MFAKKSIPQRILAVLLSVLMVLVLLPAIAATGGLAAAASCFAVTSDVHGNADNVDTWLIGNNQDNALKYMVFGGDQGSVYWKTSASGDLSTISTDAAGTADGDQTVGKLQALFSSPAHSNVTPIFTMGNHDWYIGTYGTYSNADSLSFTPITGFTRTGVQNAPSAPEAIASDGYVIYTLGASSGGVGIDFAAADISALEAALNAAAAVNAAAPFFIVSHYPLHSGDGRTASTGFGENLTGLINLLNGYPNAFFFWGHNHHNDPNMTTIKGEGDTITPAVSGGTATPIHFTYCNSGHMNGGTGVRVEITGNAGLTTVSLTIKRSDGTTVSSKVVTFGGAAPTLFDGGTGSQGDPYIIASAAALQDLGAKVNTGNDYSEKYFLQAADIDLSGISPWTPIGTYISNSQSNYPFAGIYDGNGYIISGLRMKNHDFTGSGTVNKGYGLFGYLTGTVQNLGLTGVDISVTNKNAGSDGNYNAYAGGIAGYMKNGNIINSYAVGSAAANTSSSSARCCAGGLVGYLKSGNVTNAYAAVQAEIGGTHSETAGAGGLAGYKESGTFEYCYWNTDLSSNACDTTASADGATGMTTLGATDGMKQPDFVAALNANAGACKSWSADVSPSINEGYPIHARSSGTACQVMFDTLSSYVTSPSALCVYYGQPYGALPVLSWPGYTFMGWWTASSDGERVTDSTPVSSTSDHTLYARWAAADPAWDGSVADSFDGGDGSASDPYLIGNASQLAYLAQLVNSKTGSHASSHYRQTADIDLNSKPWTPIGSYSNGGTDGSVPFAGTYDGDGYMISNLSISVSIDAQSATNKAYGLFGYVTGNVSNVGLTGAGVSVTNPADSSSGRAYAGGITGYLTDGSIRNSYVIGTVSGSTNYSSSVKCTAGGVAGYAPSGTIENCYAAVSASISGLYASSNSGAGGLVGYANSLAVNNSYWNTDSGFTALGIGNGTPSGTGATGMTTTEMKAADFVTQLNSGTGGDKTWMADAETPLNGGYPLHTRIITKVLAGISVSGQKTDILSGQPFDSSSMVVTAQYTDGTTAAVTGYTCTPEGPLTANTTITIGYTENGVTKTTSFSVTVIPSGGGSGTPVSGVPDSAVLGTAVKVFSDIDEGVWYFGAVRFVVSEGLFVGTSDMLFEPRTPMTRAMLMAVLYRMDGSPPVDASSPFEDVPVGTWYTDAVFWARQNGITAGYDDGTFRPHQNVTREQLAVFLSHYAKYKGYSIIPGSSYSLQIFSDASEISGYATPAIKWACFSRLIKGKPGPLLAPLDTATRAEVATILRRFIGETED